MSPRRRSPRLSGVGPLGGGGTKHAETSSDANGLFELTGLGEGRYSVSVRPPIGVDANYPRFVLDGLSAVNLGDIHIERSGSLTVRVFGPDGKPVKRLDITVTTSGRTYAALVSLGSEYHVPRAAPGKGWVSCSYEGVPNGYEIEIFPGELTELDIHQSKIVHADWSCRVVDHRGKPVEVSWASVDAADDSWSSSHVQPVSNGSFQLIGRLEGKALLSVALYEDRHGILLVPINFSTPGGGPARIIVPTASIAGDFPDNRRAIRLEVIHLDWWRPACPESMREEEIVAGGFMREDDDEYDMRYLEAGAYRLDWYDKNAALLESQEFTLKKGEHKEF